MMLLLGKCVCMDFFNVVCMCLVNAGSLSFLYFNASMTVCAFILMLLMFDVER